MPRACKLPGQTERVTDIRRLGQKGGAFQAFVLPLLFEGVLQHFDSPHQVLFHILLPFPLTLKKRNLSLKHTYTQHGEERAHHICPYKHKQK